MKVFAVTPPEFDGSTDETDGLILWVKAPDLETVRKAYPKAEIDELDFEPSPEDIDRAIK